MDKTTVKAVEWVDKLPPLRFGRCLTILTLALLVFSLLVAGVAYQLKGTAGIYATAVAAGVCWVGATLTLAGTHWLGRIPVSGPLYTLACGMVFNCALPFLVGLTLFRAGGELSRAGVFGMIVVFFQFALAVSTVLSLCMIKSRR